MGNSFNISVKPEIAALELKVDAVKADTGPIRNDVTAIHDTMLPSIKSDTGALRNDMTDIHNTDLPLVKTDTGAIRNDVDDLKTLANAIKLKTDTIPQVFRGETTAYGLSTSLATFTTAVNLTSTSGKLIMLWSSGHATGAAEVKCTIDGTVYTTLVHAGGSDSHYLYLSYAPYDAVRQFLSSTTLHFTNIEFNDSCKIEVRSVDSQNLAFKFYIIED